MEPFGRLVYLSSMNGVAEKERMYRALVARDAASDGAFFVGVRTTGIFCRPTCPAKKPRIENVEFFSTAREALCAGYRPCLRCSPMDAHRRPPEWVARLLEAVEESAGDRLDEAALRRRSIDPGRARRYFKSHYGMTFAAYQRARRMGEALKAVREGADPGSVARRHGFESESGFRDAFLRVFGVPPGRAGEVRCLLAKWLDTPLGAMLALADDDGLRLLEFVDRRALESEISFLRQRLGVSIVPGSCQHLETIEREIAAYFAGRLREFRVRIATPQTPMQRDVWACLQRIPMGETVSYGWVARQVGRPTAARAVARAVGQNRLAIVIPCHRVIGNDGSLTGYGGGLWRKERLLELERDAAPAAGRQAALFRQASC